MKCASCKKIFLTPEIPSETSSTPPDIHSAGHTPSVIKQIPRNPNINVYTAPTPEKPQLRYFQEPHRAGTILVLGLLGLFLFPPIGIAAWSMGATDLAKMNQGGMDSEGRDKTQIGYICGIVGVIGWAITLIVIYIATAGVGL